MSSRLGKTKKGKKNEKNIDYKKGFVVKDAEF
jgi:hypothetical protein